MTKKNKDGIVHYYSNFRHRLVKICFCVDINTSYYNCLYILGNPISIFRSNKHLKKKIKERYLNLYNNMHSGSAQGVSEKL